MTLQIELPPELECDLVTAAGKHGVSPGDYALSVLRTALSVEPPRSGVELVAYWRNEGLIGSRSDIADSQAHARKVRDAAQHRTRE
jgi:hypothetical protein